VSIARPTVAALSIQVIATLAIAALTAACGGTPAPSSLSAPTTPQPARARPSSTAAPSPGMTTAFAPSGAPAGAASGSPSDDPGHRVLMDPGLLSILPSAIGGAKVALEPDSFGEAVKDASFAGSVDAAAFAVVIDGADLASGVVAHLRAGVFTEGFLRDWRDTYDTGACAQAGGVAARAETTLGGRAAWITTCSGGLRTYHAWVPERGVVVSLISVGERRFGEQLLAGIRP
jgi:hypothetical protein